MKKTYLLIIALAAVMSAGAQRIVTLQQCIDNARNHNRNLQKASLDIQMASEQAAEARTKYYPQISANAMAFQAFDKMIKADGTVPMEVAVISQALAPYAGQPYSISELNRSYTAMLSVVEPIYAGGQIHTANDLAQLQTDVKQLQYKLTETEVTQKVTENFWKIVAVKYNLMTLDAADKQIAALYKHVEQYVQAGVVNRNDLLKVKLRQQELASSRLKLENARTVLLMLLAQQAGFDDEIDIEFALEPTAEAPHTLYAAPAEAAANRTEVALAQKAVQAQQLQVKMERGKNMPTVALGLMGFNTSVGGLSTTVRNALKHNMTNAMLSATVSVPISSWWGGSKAIKRQKLALEQKQIAQLDTEERVRIDIQTAWANLTEAYKQIDIARSSVEQAEENLRISTESYNAGTENLTDLLDAETLNRQAHNSLGQALAGYQLQKAVYELKTK